MRILLTGSGGQLGRHLKPRLESLGAIIATDRGTVGDFQCDLSDRRLVDKMLNRVRPNLIVNPAAWTAVDQAEDEPEASLRLNRDLPGWLGEWAAAHDAVLTHFSTDYVFSGAVDRGWRENDAPSPGNVYGRSKFEGEQAIQRSGATALIVRTAWLYSRYPGNFLSAILTRASQGKSLTIVNDQTGSPTWAGHLADATVALLTRRDSLPDRCTLMHVAGAGQMTWYEFGRMAIRQAAELGLIDHSVEVAPIASAAWPQKARRPTWSVLDCDRYAEFTGLPLPTVEQSLKACLNEWRSMQC